MKLLPLLSASLLFAFSAALLPAADLYWYPGAPTQGGNGTWNTAATNWRPNADGSGSATAWDNANLDDAIFGGLSGNVSLAAPITSRSLSFQTTGYALSSTTGANTLTLSGSGGGGIHVATGTASISSVVNSSLLITKTGSGTLQLSGANTLSGGIFLSQGAIQTTGASGILGTTTLRMADGTRLISTSNSSNSLGPTRASAGDGYLIDNGATVTFETAFTGAGSTGNNQFSGNATVGNNVTVVKTGAGTMTLNQGSANFGATTANTWRVDQGLLQFNNNDRFGAAGNQIVLNGGGLRLQAGDVSTNRTITLNNVAGNTFEVQGGRTLTLNATNQLTGAGGFTKADTGTLTISAAQNFTGSAIVEAGTLILSGTGALTGASGVSVSSGATLQNNSSASMTRALTLAEGALLSGSGAFAPVSLSITANLSDGFTTFALGSTSLTKGGTLAFTLSGIVQGTYTVFSGSALSSSFSGVSIGDNALSSIGSGNFSGVVGGLTYTFDNTANTLTVVPEPSALILAGLGLAAVAWMRRRRA